MTASKNGDLPTTMYVSLEGVFHLAEPLDETECLTDCLVQPHDRPESEVPS